MRKISNDPRTSFDEKEKKKYFAIKREIEIGPFFGVIFVLNSVVLSECSKRERWKGGGLRRGI